MRLSLVPPPNATPVLPAGRADFRSKGGDHFGDAMQPVSAFFAPRQMLFHLPLLKDGKIAKSMQSQGLRAEMPGLFLNRLRASLCQAAGTSRFVSHDAEVIG
jgi:hypothetical protein